MLFVFDEILQVKFIAHALFDEHLRLVLADLAKF